MKETLKGKVIPNILEKRDSNIPLPKRPLSKLDPDDMIKILNKNERDKITKELYKNEAERASATIKLFDKKIRDNPTMSNKEINIITHLKNIYELRGEYYVNKFNNEPEKNKFIDRKSIDNNIYQLENELRDQKGSGAFTYQNDFVKLLNLLAQLLTKNNSKKLKDDMSQLSKNLYDNKQITKQAYNDLIKAITYKMTRKEQNKILADKIDANNAQYDLDRMNAEISAYSSGNLPKYEYLTKKDLNYKPNAFEQAKFEYSPLGKVFIDGLDKSDRKEGLLKRLKNIEDKNNNQLLALRDINRPAIRGRNNGDDDDDNDDDNDDDDYKTIQNLKKKLTGEKILDEICSEKFDNIINKWKKTKDKDIVYINDKDKVAIRKFDIYEIFKGYLDKNINYEEIKGIIGSIKRAIELYQRKPNYSDKSKSIINNSNKIIKGIELIKSLIDDDKLRIPGKYYAKPLSNTDLSWMNDAAGYEQIAEEAGGKFMKNRDQNELKLIKNFITKINNGTINDKNKAANEFRELKQKVNDQI